MFSGHEDCGKGQHVRGVSHNYVPQTLKFEISGLPACVSISSCKQAILINNSYNILLTDAPHKRQRDFNLSHL